MQMKIRHHALLPLFVALVALLIASCTGGSQSSRDRDDSAAPLSPQTSSGPSPAKRRAAQGKTAEETASAPLEPGRGASVGGMAYREQVEEPSTEEYDRIYDNEYTAAARTPLSTFSIDVDAASYSNTRRFIRSGQIPPKDAVRVEEMINYFTYDYPQPKKNQPFSITTDLAACPWNNAHKIVQIGIQGKKIPMDDLPPSNLVFLIDVSGSMNEPNKLPLLKKAFSLLVDQLRDRDHVAIVVYAGAAGLVLPPTSGKDKAAIFDAIDRLQAGGSTAGGAGIKLAYETAKSNFLKDGNNRVILATDGDFNVGVSSDAELVRLIEEKRETGVFLTVLSFGSGNLKDSKMEQLADKGNGHYAYIDGIDEAKKVFVNELGATLFTIAKDVKIQVEFNPAKVKAYRLVGYENRMLKAEDFNNDKKDAGELGAGHSVTALYEVVPVGVDVQLASVDPLKYQPVQVNRANGTTNELMTVKLRYKEPKDSVSKLIVGVIPDANNKVESASENLRFASAVAGWGMLLRDSKFKGNITFDALLALANGAIGTDAHGYRADFIKLVQESRKLMGK
jgi:Ca-activated chloride channel family protein